MKRTAQSGFTLLEIMIVVALIGVLAAVALPSFTTQSRKAKGDAEVAAFFGELKVREEQYALENGKYLSTGSSETALFPATPTPNGTTVGTLPTSWQSLKVRTPEDKAKCGYVVIAGTRTDTTVGSLASSFGYTPPAKNWFYIVARCDLDGNSTVDSYYFISNDNNKIQKLNYGQ